MLVILLHVGVVKVLKVITLGILNLVALTIGVVAHHFAFAIVPVLKLFANNDAISVNAVGSCSSWLSPRISGIWVTRRTMIWQISLLQDDGIQTVIDILAVCARFCSSMDDEGPKLVGPGSMNLEVFGAWICGAAIRIRDFLEFEQDIALKDESVVIQGFSFLVERLGRNHAIAVKSSREGCSPGPGTFFFHSEAPQKTEFLGREGFGRGTMPGSENGVPSGIGIVRNPSLEGRGECWTA